MNKLFTKIAGFTLGLAMAAGVGIGVSQNKVGVVKAEDSYEAIGTFDFSETAASGTTSTSLDNAGIKTLLSNSTKDLTVSSVTDKTGNVYSGKGSGGTGIPQQILKIGKASGDGGFTFTIAGVDKVSKIDFVCYGWKTTSTLSVNSSTGVKPTVAATLWQPSFVLSSATSTITISVSTSAVCVTSFTLYKKVGESVKLNSITGITGSLEAYQGDKSWDLTTLTPKGTLSDDTTKEVDISEYVELKTDDVPGTELGSKKVTVQVIDLLKTVASKSFDVDGEVIAIPPVPVTHTMADCYTVAKGTNVKFNGVYMGAYGTNPSNGIFFADGEYGIMVYGTSSVPSDWEVGKTVLAISGQTDCYNGLVQVKTASFEVTSATVAVPVVYEFTGAETTPVALSRKTSLSGKVTALKNAFESDKDTTVTIDLGGEKSASIFVKRGVFTNAQLAEFKAGFVVDNEVTVTGFLNYYKKEQTIDTAYTPSAFQIIVPTIVKVGTYTAHDYALDFISATDAVCSTPFGEDGHLTGLLAIWTELNTKYSALKDAEKVAFANPDTTDTDIKAAVARYDYICNKYNAGGVVLTEFVEGHTVPTEAIVLSRDYQNQTNTPMIIVICCAVASVTALGILIVIKRRKSSAK